MYSFTYYQYGWHHIYFRCPRNHLSILVIFVDRQHCDVSVCAEFKRNKSKQKKKLSFTGQNSFLKFSTSPENCQKYTVVRFFDRTVIHSQEAT